MDLMKTIYGEWCNELVKDSNEIKKLQKELDKYDDVLKKALPGRKIFEHDDLIMEFAYEHQRQGFEGGFRVALEYLMGNKVKEELEKARIIGMPSKAVLEALGAINAEHCGNQMLISILSYNYGLMTGKRAERERIKWNTTACFHSLIMYYEKNKKFPDSLFELKCWTNKMEETQE